MTIWDYSKGCSAIVAGKTLICAAWRRVKTRRVEELLHSVLLRKKGRSPGELLRGDEVISTTPRVPGGSVRLEIAPRLLIRHQRVGRNLAIEHELCDWCRHPIQYRERSDRMPALDNRKNS